MPADVTVQVEGIERLLAILRAIPAKLRRRALRNALAAGARMVRDEAKRDAPVIAPTSYVVRSGRRSVGLVRDRIRVRTSRDATAAGNVGVFVNVKPAGRSIGAKSLGKRDGLRGAKSPTDPYYWRWIEFGSKRMRRSGGFRFLTRAAQAALPRALAEFERQIGPQIERLGINPDDPL